MELLIVIAILGILAVGLLIALDPVEQTRRATDTGAQQSAGESKNAINRYFTSKLYYPWCTPASAGSTCTYIAGCADAVTVFGTAGTCAATVLADLVATGELKTAPPTNIANRLNLALSGGGATFQVSFIPAAKSFKTTYVTTLGTAGVYTTTACTVLGTAATCPSTSATCAYCVF